MTLFNAIAAPWYKRLGDYVYRERHVFIPALIAGATLALLVFLGGSGMWCATNMSDAVEGGRMAFERLDELDARMTRNQDETRMSIRNIEVTNGRIDERLTGLTATQSKMLDIMLASPRHVVATTNDRTHE